MSSIKTIRKYTIGQFATGGVVTVSPDTSAWDILEIMKTQNIRHIPVLESNKAVGILSHRDLMVMKDRQWAHKFTASDLMIKNPIAVPAETALDEVVRMMSKKKIGSILISEKGLSIKGIFTTTDALNVLSMLLDEKFPTDNIKDFVYESCTLF